MTSTTFANNKDTYEAALRSLFRGKPEDTEADLSKMFLLTFRMEANVDEKLDFPEFVAHMRRLREMQFDVSLTSVQFLRDGSQLAERHTSVATMPDGTVAHAETFQFAEVAEDGRLAWIVETVQRK